MHRICVIVALAAVALGCSSTHSSDSADGTGQVRGESDVADRDTGSDGADDVDGDADDADDAGAGSGLPVEIPRIGLAFSVPETYTLLDPIELSGDDYESTWFSELADSVDMPVEQLAAALRSNLEAYLFAPVADGYSDNVTVETLPASSLPGTADIEEELEPLGVTEPEVAEHQIDGLQVVRASYTYDGGERYGYDVYVESEAGVIEISVTAASQRGAQAVGERIVQTIAGSG